MHQQICTCNYHKLLEVARQSHVREQTSTSGPEWLLNRLALATGNEPAFRGFCWNSQNHPQKVTNLSGLTLELTKSSKKFSSPSGLILEVTKSPINFASPSGLDLEMEKSPKFLVSHAGLHHSFSESTKHSDETLAIIHSD